MATLKVRVSQEAEAFAQAEAQRRGLPDAGAFVAALLEEAAGTNGTHAARPPMPGEFFRSTTIEGIVAEQGIQAVADVSALYGDFWPPEESADDFLSAVKQWRRGGKPGSGV
jgi:hypothetical protein